MRLFKGRMIGLILTVLLLLSIFPITSLAAASGDYEYTVSDGKATITGYTGSGGNITIPPTLGGYPVTSIGDFAFVYCLQLTSVSIPSGVTSIGSHAFYMCQLVENIAIPDTVKSIGSGAFSDCSKLKSIAIPSGVTKINDYTFYECTSMTDVSIPPSVTSIDEAAFNICTSLNRVTIPYGVSKISDYSFAGCESLANVTIPSGVTSIGDSAFAGCRSLTSVTVPDSVANIDGWAFYRASSLNAAYFKGNPPVSFGEYVFDETGSQFTIYYNPAKAGWTTPTWNGYKTVAVPATPSITAEPASYNSNKISWNKVLGVSAYQIYRATSSTGTYSLLKTTTSTSYTNSGLTTGKTYYYKVRAYKTIDGEKVYSSFSSVKSAKPVPATPSANAASRSYNSVKIGWSQISGASGYEVYRATSKSGTFSKLYTATSGSTVSYKNKNLTTGKTYYYKVRAYRTVDGKKVYGSFSSVKSAKPLPAIPTGIKAAKVSSTSIKVSWGSVSGASGYEVYRATSKDGKYTKIKSTTSKSYTNTGLSKGKTYYYKVRAYRTVNGKKVYGSYTGKVKTKL